MNSWYAVKTVPGRETRAKRDIEHRFASLGLSNQLRQIAIPSETVIVERNGQKRESEKRTMPGYLLVNMRFNDDSWSAVKTTPGVLGFVGGGGYPVPLSAEEVGRLLGHATTRTAKALFALGDIIEIKQGHPLAGMNARVDEVNDEARKLRVAIEIFERETLAELSFDNVARKVS